MNKRVLPTIIATTVATAMAVAISTQAYAKGWGLGYPKDGGTPRGNESADFLSPYNAYYVGDTSQKIIYLTFDAGYENGFTETILDTLKKNDVPATFFLVGTYLRDNPDIVKRMVDEGHIVGNHTFAHPDMTAKDKEGFAAELERPEKLYKELTGKDMPKYYRPPEGKYDENTLKYASELGYKTIFWSLAYADWDNNNQPSKEQAFSKLLPRIHEGAIILLHNTAKINSIILDDLIVKYREMGYTFASLDDLTGNSTATKDNESSSTSSIVSGLTISAW